MIRIKKSLLAASMLTGLFAVPTLDTPALASKHEPTHKIDVVAHRGAAGYAPENTMAAFHKGVEMKADYIELDVQMTKDGHLVIIHDNAVDRTTNGTGKVGELTLQELRALDAGSKFNPAFAGERIPTFEEVLDEFHGKTGLLIELKSPELYPGIEEKVAIALRERNMDKPANEKIIVQSFNFESMKTFRQLMPNMPIGVLTSSASDLTDEKLDEFATYANYVNPSQKLVTKQVVERVHARDMDISAWTVRKKEEVKPLLDAGVDDIITDYPDYVPHHTQYRK
ncbi:glycerophosphodiester phosphodiesterase family protein [Aneurinibacillus migulanus]|uniref:glycerophosphodiester phosphodiesterase n=1 Tax=Aneurinibacillus migulanus TaxID=47500 RepID=UPI002E23A323|nr:glycerophosphodiester phosphodiesterase family protein [Aneurinibacillus migulanus]MED4730613.1 glycerophosphodiester phosphodiesterase family protein [Aneurinibacillus migulanus]